MRKTGVILVNLGTPTEPTARAVSRFLRQFLADQRVVELPRILWRPLLNAIVIPLRAGRVAKAYAKIWTDRGSPLRAITEDQATALQAALDSISLANPLEETSKQGDGNVLVTWAMTYGAPRLVDRVAWLTAQSIERILIIPMYPQYSGSTTGAVYDQVAAIYKNSRRVPDIRMVNNYFAHPYYIDALATSVRRHWQNNARAQRLLMSFHGLPEKYSEKGDPYEAQCRQTASLLAKALQLSATEWGCGFQSRFGRTEWIKPYTDDLLAEWVDQGITSVDVICPSFSADCLETREEIAMQSKALFFDRGGQDFSFIDCLNSAPPHIRMLEKIVMENIS